jgi:hypothetical protein
VVILSASIVAAAVAVLLSLSAARGASSTPQRRQVQAVGVGSLLTSPLPVPAEISLTPSPSIDAANAKISRDQVIAEFQQSIGKNGTLHSVDYFLVTAPGYAPNGTPFKDKPAWVVVVSGRTEFPHGHPVVKEGCGEKESSTNPACQPTPVKPIHVNRFYVLDPSTGNVWISVGTVIP